jgi:hypothetical protein
MALPARLDMREVRGKPKIRSQAHRDWVRSHRCCVPGCQLMPIECAHVRRAGNSGQGFKPSDAFTVSLCAEHHAESHRGERTFESKHGVDLMALAEEFYRRSPHRNKLDDPYA